MQELCGVRVSRDPSQHPIDAKAHLVQVSLACTVHYLQHMQPQNMSKSLSHNLNASSSRKSQIDGTEEEEKHMMRSFEIEYFVDYRKMRRQGIDCSRADLAFS
jgi:hypothetical protein